MCGGGLPHDEEIGLPLRLIIVLQRNTVLRAGE
jgi:hypothetical protein